ncbi:helix-turn-helix domain-containing protein [Agromyces sp. NPDC057679]|uniref:helix-turn-helix domain-containing protein n=1 Tax=Agromyces sp. NPDC057679 TaxID=3346207 RepID=UPI003671249B
MMNAIAEWIGHRRAVTGRSQSDSAHAAGISPDAWAKIESGELEPTLGQLSGIATSLGASLGSLLSAVSTGGDVVFAVRRNRAAAGPEELDAMSGVLKQIESMLDLDTHLRYIGVGRHWASEHRN